MVALDDGLAREGARGLTFRAVDAEAGVATGTATNYFRTRDDLLNHAALRIHERFGPDPSASTWASPCRRSWGDLGEERQSPSLRFSLRNEVARANWR
jgi:hypothetical protein